MLLPCLVLRGSTGGPAGESPAPNGCSPPRPEIPLPSAGLIPELGKARDPDRPVRVARRPATGYFSVPP